MSAALEKLINEARERGRKQGLIKVTKRIIESGLLSNEKIAEILELPLEEVNAIAEDEEITAISERLIAENKSVYEALAE